MIDSSCVNMNIIQKLLIAASYLLLFAGVMAIIFFPDILRSFKKLQVETGKLVDSNNGIVTVADLAFKAQVSPAKAQKFLTKFANGLGVETEVAEDSGAVYYRFITAKNIKMTSTTGSSKNQQKSLPN